jgi:hypothetical protein
MPPRGRAALAAAAASSSSQAAASSLAPDKRDLRIAAEILANAPAIKGDLADSLRSLGMAVGKRVVQLRHNRALAARQAGPGEIVVLNNTEPVAKPVWPAGHLPLLADAARLLYYHDYQGINWYAAAAAADRLVRRSRFEGGTARAEPGLLAPRPLTELEQLLAPRDAEAEQLLRPLSLQLSYASGLDASTASAAQLHTAMFTTAINEAQRPAWEALETLRVAAIVLVRGGGASRDPAMMLELAAAVRRRRFHDTHGAWRQQRIQAMQDDWVCVDAAPWPRDGKDGGNKAAAAALALPAGAPASSAAGAASRPLSMQLQLLVARAHEILGWCEFVTEGARVSQPPAGGHEDPLGAHTQTRCVTLSPIPPSPPPRPSHNDARSSRPAPRRVSLTHTRNSLSQLCVSTPVSTPLHPCSPPRHHVREVPSFPPPQRNDLGSRAASLPLLECIPPPPPNPLRAHAPPSCSPSLACARAAR